MSCSFAADTVNEMRVLIVALVVLFAACGEAQPTPGAPATSIPAVEAKQGTRWGFTPFPADTTDQAIRAAWDFVTAESDVIAHHFDGSIPWSHLTGGDALPADLDSELAGRAALNAARTDAPVYVGTALTNLERTGLPRTRAGDNVPTGVTDSLGDPIAQQALSAWIDLLIDRLEPDYLNIAIEIDMYAANRPDDWDAALGFYRDTYARVKAEHPDLVVFASFQMEFGDPEAFASVAESSDAIGISAYPYINADGVPAEDYFDRVSGTGLPMMIVETGFPAGSVLAPRGEVIGTPEQQVDYVRWLGERADAMDLAFVVWFLPFDIDALVDRPGTPASAAAFVHLGLVDADGVERPALDVWRSLRES